MFLAKIWSYDPRCKGPVLTLLPSWKTERDGDEPSASCKYPKVTWSSKAFVQRLIEIIWQKVQRKVSESIFSFILLQTIHSLSILVCFIGGKKHSLWVLFCADDSQDFTYSWGSLIPGWRILIHVILLPIMLSLRKGLSQHSHLLRLKMIGA